MPFGSEAAGFAPGRGGIPLGRGLAPFCLVESYAADVLISCSLMIEMVADLSLYSFSLEVSCNSCRPSCIIRACSVVDGRCLHAVIAG